jgi:adenosine deaminase
MRKFGPKGYSPFYTRFFKMMEYSREMEVIRDGALQLVKAAIKVRDELGLPIVGIDLAGQEDGYPPGKFKEVYDYAHKHFMHKTVHAGEAYGAESIFQAITDCYADRIGHGYYLFDENKIADENITDRKKYVNDLASYIADKRVMIEVCLTSNLQTNPTLKDIKDHPFGKMLQNRMSVSLCTDNRLVSNTTMSREYKLATDNFELPTATNAPSTLATTLKSVTTPRSACSTSTRLPPSTELAFKRLLCHRAIHNLDLFQRAWPLIKTHIKLGEFS